MTAGLEVYTAKGNIAIGQESDPYVLAFYYSASTPFHTPYFPYELIRKSLVYVRQKNNTDKYLGIFRRKHILNDTRRFSIYSEMYQVRPKIKSSNTVPPYEYSQCSDLEYRSGPVTDIDVAIFLPQSYYLEYCSSSGLDPYRFNPSNEAALAVHDEEGQIVLDSRLIYLKNVSILNPEGVSWGWQTGNINSVQAYPNGTFNPSVGCFTYYSPSHVFSSPSPGDTADQNVFVCMTPMISDRWMGMPNEYINSSEYMYKIITSSIGFRQHSGRIYLNSMVPLFDSLMYIRRGTPPQGVWDGWSVTDNDFIIPVAHIPKNIET